MIIQHDQVRFNQGMQGWFSHVSEWLSSKRTQTTNVGDHSEKTEHSYTVGGIVNWCSHCGNSMKAPQKTKNRTTI